MMRTLLLACLVGCGAPDVGTEVACDRQYKVTATDAAGMVVYSERRAELQSALAPHQLEQVTVIGCEPYVVGPECPAGSVCDSQPIESCAQLPARITGSGMVIATCGSRTTRTSAGGAVLSETGRGFAVATFWLE
jgi:hypothetical protein